MEKKILSDYQSYRLSNPINVFITINAVVDLKDTAENCERYFGIHKEPWFCEPWTEVDTTVEEMNAKVTAFLNLPPQPDSIDFIRQLGQDKGYKLYLLFHHCWWNPSAFTIIRDWLIKFLGKGYKKRVLFATNLNFIEGGIFIDLHQAMTACGFRGCYLRIGGNYPDWQTVKQAFEVEQFTPLIILERTKKEIEVNKNINNMYRGLLAERQNGNIMSVYICMDTCVFDYAKALKPFRDNDNWLTTKEREALLYEHPEVLETITPIEGSIETIKKLMEDPKLYDINLLIENTWNVRNGFELKKTFIKKYLPFFGEDSRESDKIIFGYQKDMLIGHFLVEDFRCGNQEKFKGWYVPMFSTEMPTWEYVGDLLLKQRPFLLRYFQKPLKFDDFSKDIRLSEHRIFY